MAEQLTGPPVDRGYIPGPTHPDDIEPSAHVVLAGAGDAPPEEFRADDAVRVTIPGDAPPP